jgi:branched-chain amino acid transport system ATP-binding protein
MLEVIGIHTYYEESHILHGVSLKVGQGSVGALVGRNGMGKTTTIRSIIGFNPPRQGAVRFKDIDIAGIQAYRIAQMGLALIPQGRQIFPSLSVRENLTMSSRNVKKGGAWTLERIYSLFPILRNRSNIKGHLLSGGEQQMLSIGRALMTNPDMLLMDEPSEGLAPLIVQHVTETITQLKKGNLAVLLVEQNLDVALGVGDYVYVLNKGVIVYESTPDKFRKNEEIKDKYLGI